MTSPANFSTPYRLIRLAMRDAKLLGEGDDPNSEQLAENSDRLCDLINFWQTQGLRLWLETDLSVTLLSGLGTYSFGSGGTVNMTRPLRVKDSGYFRDQTGNQRPIDLYARDTYNNLSNVSNTGPINGYWPDKQQLLLVVKFWMVPDATAALGTAHLIIQQQVTNFTGLTDVINFPVEWFLALRKGLAADIATGQPSGVIAKLTREAEMTKQALDDWDTEDASVRITPDPQYAGYSRFSR